MAGCTITALLVLVSNRMTYHSDIILFCFLKELVAPLLYHFAGGDNDLTSIELGLRGTHVTTNMRCVCRSTCTQSMSEPVPA